MSRQSTGAESAGGRWACVGVVQHQVHNAEGAEIGEEEAEAPGSVMEQEEEWGQQAGWGRAARGRKQVPDEGQEVAPEEARVEQASKSGRAQVQEGKATTKSYVKRQMLWKSMVGRS